MDIQWRIKQAFNSVSTYFLQHFVVIIAIERNCKRNIAIQINMVLIYYDFGKGAGSLTFASSNKIWFFLSLRFSQHNLNASQTQYLSTSHSMVVYFLFLDASCILSHIL